MERFRTPSRVISDETLKVIRDRFDNDPIVIKMRIEQDMALRARHNPAEAMRIGAKINNLFDSVVSEYCAKCEREAKEMEGKVNLNDTDMNEEQAKGITTVCIALFMLSDMAETGIMDATDRIKRISPDLDFGIFSDVRDAMMVLRDKLQVLTKSTNLRDDARWGDECDKMYEMMKNKAAKLMRMSEGPGWGKDEKKRQN